MKFRQLNDGWNAEPNAPHVNIEVLGTDILVRFYLNPFQFYAFTLGDTGTLTFHNCLQYRFGYPNDEGFAECRYYKYGIAWGEFYLIEDSHWKESFPEPIAVSEQPTENMNHYLFYFRDDTFECIADSYDFAIDYARGT